MKIVLHKTFGAFRLPAVALERLAHLKGIPLYKQETNGWVGYYTSPCFAEISFWSPYDWDRTDPDLATVVEELGETATNGLVVRDMHSGQQYRIREYDGKEWLEFPSDIKWEIAK